jgi:hypothetical protein
MLSVRLTIRKSHGRTARAKGLGRDVLERIEELRAIREDVRRIAAAHGAGNVRWSARSAAASRVSPAISTFWSTWRKVAACST